MNMVLTRSVKRTADWPTPLRAAQVATTVFGAPIWGDAAVREPISQSISVLADEMMLTYERIAIVLCSRLASSVGDRPFPINSGDRVGRTLELDQKIAVAVVLRQQQIRSLGGAIALERAVAISPDNALERHV